jgi:hypothetical protein
MLFLVGFVNSVIGSLFLERRDAQSLEEFLLGVRLLTYWLLDGLFHEF